MVPKTSLSLLLVVLACCAPRVVRPAAPAWSGANLALEKAEHAYVIEFLRRNPAVSTSLGGPGLNASLLEAEGRLRDHSRTALEDEDRWLAETAQQLEAVMGAQDPGLLIDREVSLAQIRFLLHQHQVRRYQERSVDSYIDEPFRSVDWQLQTMAPHPDGSFGTDEEWQRVATRLEDTVRYFQVARAQLEAGIRSHNTPDGRLLVRHGLEGSARDASYFASAFPALVDARVGGLRAPELRAQLKSASQRAAEAYQGFHQFLSDAFFDAPELGTKGLKRAFQGDRFAMGEAEYDWAVHNNLHLTANAKELFEQSWPVVLETRGKLLALAQEIAVRRHLDVSGDPSQVLKVVKDELGKDAPRTDAEMLEGYRKAVARLVAYARTTHLFEVPADYRLEVLETPPPLRASLAGAAYSPAPPFQANGVGRFYVTPTGDGPGRLRAGNFHSMAALAAHEGFPGHDWHYKLMTRFRDSIGWVRWLTPGAVEDSSAMWEDSMAAEGWGLYAEALVAEPRPEAPHGFYTQEERLYQLSAQLFRDLRVRLDTGLHTGRLSYDDAVDLAAQVLGSVTGSCRDAANRSGVNLQSCQRAEQEIYRYSVGPTQAITYRLGKEQLLALRKEAERALGPRFSLQRFHLEVMRQGTIPPGYFGGELVRSLMKTSDSDSVPSAR